MPHNEVQRKLVKSLDSFEEIRAVNVFLQGVCHRSVGNELGIPEVRGMIAVLAWQNEKMLAAESVVQNILDAKTALRAV